MENSVLGQLPAELRNLIWEAALYEPEGVQIWREPSLLRTCKAIRDEAELMFYSVNEFSATINEEAMDHALCSWLKRKAGARLKQVRRLAIHCRMPSIDDRRDSAPGPYEDHSQTVLGFLQLMHLMDSLRAASFETCLGDVVRFTLNGADDEEPLDSIEEMPDDDQDYYRGAKFLIVCLVYGEIETMEALDSSAPHDRLMSMDEIIQRRRREYEIQRRGMVAIEPDRSDDSSSWETVEESDPAAPADESATPISYAE